MTKIPKLWLLILLPALITGCINLDLASTDEEAFSRLEAAGSDLTRVHPFDFYLYHPDESGAKELCGYLETEGFEVSLQQGATEGSWLCLASTRFVPSLDKLAEYRDFFDETVGVYGGEYDGWETMVIPK